MPEAVLETTQEKSSTKQRSGKEVIIHSKAFAREDRRRSWWITASTGLLLLAAFGLTLAPVFWPIRLVGSILFGLLIVRFFVIYHDYLHKAILQNSVLARWIMSAFGVFVLAPPNIWSRTHDHHHHHNSKLSNLGIGSFPLVSRTQYNAFSKGEKLRYLLARHPLTIAFGYISLFILDFNVKSIILSPRKHWDSFIALAFHFMVGGLLFWWGGWATLLVSWVLPFLIADGLGAYLFYAQHNFPGATFKIGRDWSYYDAALDSTSLLKMNPIMEWFTGNIGYHHVHHINHRIPLYRLKEAMTAIPELHHPKTTSLKLRDVAACLRLKIWDEDQGRMTPLK